jgi:hypothetical protein
MRIACWILKATVTYWEYVIVIAFFNAKMLHKVASILCYTYILAFFWNLKKQYGTTSINSPRSVLRFFSTIYFWTLKIFLYVELLFVIIFLVEQLINFKEMFQLYSARVCRIICSANINIWEGNFAFKSHIILYSILAHNGKINSPLIRQKIFIPVFWNIEPGKFVLTYLLHGAESFLRSYWFCS